MSKKTKSDPRCSACEAYLSKYNIHNNGLCSPCNSKINLSLYDPNNVDHNGKRRFTKSQKN